MVWKRENKARIRYSRDDLRALLKELTVHNDSRIDRILDTYEKRRSEGPDRPCQEVVRHGPGHQSTTFCQATGDHEEHYARLPSGDYADWTDDRPYYGGY